MTWSSIGNSEIDAESPLDETLMTKIRDNLVYLYDRVAMILLDDQTVSGVTEVIVNGKFTSAYKEYIWVLEELKAPSANSNVTMLVSTDGSTYSTASYAQGAANTVMGSANAAFTLSSAGLALLGNTDYPMDGEIRIFNPLSSASRKQFQWSINYKLSSGDRSWTLQGGTWEAATSAIVALKITMGGNTFNGRFKLFGIP